MLARHHKHGQSLTQWSKRTDARFILLILHLKQVLSSANEDRSNIRRKYIYMCIFFLLLRLQKWFSTIFNDLSKFMQC